MHIFGWLIIIGVLFGLGIVLKNKYLNQQTQAATSLEESDASVATAPSGFARLTTELKNRVQTFRNGSGKKSPQQRASLFRQWANQAFTSEPEIQQWLEMLSDDQITVLCEHLEEFCRDMGFELNWLLEGQVALKSELAKGLTNIVRLYSQASYQAVHIQEEVGTFRIYHEYMQDPQSRANRELGEHLFGKLLEQGKSPIKISEHLAASPRKRQQQITETLQRLASDEPQTLHQTVKLVQLDRAMAQLNGQAPVNGSAPTEKANAGAA